MKKHHALGLLKLCAVSSTLSLLMGMGLLSAHAQSDVTQPSDAIVASSSNSPGSEGVANAIDNTQAKYLNRDLANDAKPAGFAVTPAVGVTRVIGMKIQSANDAADRDPKTLTLEGSNDGSLDGFNGATNTWELIVGLTNIPAWTARFQTQTFFFDNFKAYKHYRWTVIQTQGPSTCCMQIAEVELLGGTLPPDVTQPGDPVIASSSNSPGSEGVANAIDNTQAKYLNRDLANDAKPAGFAVSPSIGRSLVTGLTIQSANDAADRDPKTLTLEGSNDESLDGFNGATNTWELIVGITNIPAWTARFQTKTFLFDNFRPYRHYRWTVVQTQGPSTCCMQIAEVELLGTSAPKDVTQPSDPIIASSSNSPGSEGVANAIDNTQAKYLNRDLANDAKPAGFAVSPSIGASTVIGMTIQSANDAADRDPKTLMLEGSNDGSLDGFGGATNTSELIVGITNIPAWTARFQTKEFYFANKTAYKHYRWTVLQTQGPSTCCMQIAEVELLAVTQSNPCGQTSFVLQPVNTPALLGSPATFLAKVNGPWTVQWLRNGQPIPGATALSFSTPPVDASVITNDYSIAIVGCQTSQVVRASIFTPSATKSIGISFRGSGANGTPTDILTNDILGIQLQAFWNSATNATGTTGDGTALPDMVTDSDNQRSTITVDFMANGQWGAGTGVDSSLERMLNGLIHTRNSPGVPAHITFGNVPAGNHAVIVYLVGIPLQFQNGDYWVNGATSVTNYVTVMNADQYKAAPGFYRGSSTNPNARTLASFVRFDNVQPAAGGTIEVGWDTATTGGGDRGVPVNGIQLVLNAPNPGPPPAITVDPQPAVAATNGTATLTVTATGNNLTYQWRKNGVNLPNGGHISGATTSTLTISSFSDADVGIYSVAVFSAAGSVISKNASVRTSKFDIKDALVAYWKYNETSGTTVANSATNGRPGAVNGTATWVAGKIANALSFDGSTYVLVDNYAKATKGIAGSAWVRVAAGAASDAAIIQNARANLSDASPRTAGQFQLQLVLDGTDLKPEASIGIGPNVSRARGAASVSTGVFHHLAFSADGAQLRLYLDGQEVAVTDYLGEIVVPDIPFISMGAKLNLADPADPTTLGPDGTAPSFLTGLLDEAAVWTRALTADEVSKIFAAGQAGNALDTVIVTPPVLGPRLTVVRNADGSVTVSSSGGTIQQSDSLTTPTWTDAGAGPITVPAAQLTGTRYYRARQ